MTMICTECFQRYNRSTLRKWDRDYIWYKKEPFICPYCWELVHDGWTIPENILHDPLPEEMETDENNIIR